MPRDPYSPEQAARAADLIWAAVAVMLAGELAGGSPQRIDPLLTRRPCRANKKAATAAGLGKDL